MKTPPPVNSEHLAAPLQLGCRAQMLLVATFILLFFGACWTIGTMIARPS